jgi:cardiolipin synthase
MGHLTGEFIIHHRKILVLVLSATPMFFLASCRPTQYPVDQNINITGLDLDEALNRYTQTRPVAGSDAQLLIDGDQSFSAIIDLIESAQDHINVQTLNFDSDDDQPLKLGLEIARHLVAKARQGVQVNVIIDPVFQKYIAKPTALDLLRTGNVNVRLFSPPLRKILMGKLLYRTHKKMFIADGKRAIVGGSNLGSRYLGQDQWRDTNVDLTGPVVATVQREFLRDWQNLGPQVEDSTRFFPPLAPTGRLAVRVVDQRPAENSYDINQTVLIAIRSAQDHIYIETPYFNPTSWLARELLDAARRGVYVCVLTNSEESSNMVPLYWSAAYNFKSFVDQGVHIFLWNRGKRAIHSKIFVVDDRLAMISSFNFSHRSTLWDAENGVVCTDPSFVDSVRQMVEKDFTYQFIFKVDSRWLADQGREKHSLWSLTHTFGWLF